MTDAPRLSSADRTNQRNAVLAGFLGWTLDAFDFFVLTFVIDDVARSFGKTRPDIALTITLALAMRPVALAAVVLVVGVVVALAGPEHHGVSFRKSPVPEGAAVG